MSRFLLTRRIGQLLVGLFLYGIAIALMVRASIGVSPWDVLAQGVSYKTGIPFGLVTNIVGLLDTFLPWQLLERDVEVAVAYQAHAVQAWCFEYTAAGGAVPQALSNTTADAMRGGKKLQVTFS